MKIDGARELRAEELEGDYDAFHPGPGIPHRLDADVQRTDAGPVGEALDEALREDLTTRRRSHELHGHLRTAHRIVDLRFGDEGEEMGATHADVPEAAAVCAVAVAARFSLLEDARVGADVLGGHRHLRQLLPGRDERAVGRFRLFRLDGDLAREDALDAPVEGYREPHGLLARVLPVRAEHARVGDDAAPSERDGRLVAGQNAREHERPAQAATVLSDAHHVEAGHVAELHSGAHGALQPLVVVEPRMEVLRRVDAVVEELDPCADGQRPAGLARDSLPRLVRAVVADDPATRRQRPRGVARVERRRGVLRVGRET